tara:strand:+ start:1158 stop:1280 length:123 start_codon:yes stop_codon:yes gene_type:complete
LDTSSIIVNKKHQTKKYDIKKIILNYPKELNGGAKADKSG